VANYLTCYDYGQGGVWLYIEADSPSQITATYRDLEVFEATPPWWNDEMERMARSHKGETWKKWLDQFRR